MGVEPGRNVLVHFVAATPIVVAVLTSVVGGVMGALVGYQFGWPNAGRIAAGVGMFVLVFGLLMLVAHRSIARQQTAMTPLFPSPEDED